MLELQLSILLSVLAVPQLPTRCRTVEGELPASSMRGADIFIFTGVCTAGPSSPPPPSEHLRLEPEEPLRATNNL